MVLSISELEAWYMPVMLRTPCHGAGRPIGFAGSCRCVDYVSEKVVWDDGQYAAMGNDLASLLIRSATRVELDPY